MKYAMASWKFTISWSCLVLTMNPFHVCVEDKTELKEMSANYPPYFPTKCSWARLSSTATLPNPLFATNTKCCERLKLPHHDSFNVTFLILSSSQYANCCPWRICSHSPKMSPWYCFPLKRTVNNLKHVASAGYMTCLSKAISMFFLKKTTANSISTQI